MPRLALSVKKQPVPKLFPRFEKWLANTFVSQGKQRTVSPTNGVLQTKQEKWREEKWRSEYAAKEDFAVRV